MKQISGKRNEAKSNGLKNEPVISHKIGSTMYEVNVHFSEKSRETIQEKILRLIKAEVMT